MQVYYLAPNELDEFAVGIKRKVEKQCEMLQQHFSCNVKYISLASRLSIFRKITRVVPILSGYKKIDINQVEAHSIVYFRHAMLDHRLISMLRGLHKKNVTIVLEIPTYPYDSEKRTLASKMVLYKDLYYRKMLKKYVSRIITYSRDEWIHGVKTINISNAIDIKDGFYITKQEPDDCINIIAVAALAFWHGYDRLINGLHEYYANGGKRNVIFHMVGYGSELQEYTELVKKLSLEDHVILYGKKQGEELNRIYMKCNIGADSMGRHRSGVFYNSSLKGKEYLLKGLPIISGVETELDHCDEFKYYLRVPADDSPVDINRVVEFYDKVYGGKDELEIRKGIRNFAVTNYSYEATFKKVLDYLDEAIRERNRM